MDFFLKKILKFVNFRHIIVGGGDKLLRKY